MKIKQTVIAVAVLIGFGGLFVSPLVSAATCGGVTTSVIGCDNNDVGTCSDGSTPVSAKCVDPKHPDAIYTPPKMKNNGIWGLLILVINILSAGVGIAAVGGVAWGSIMYTTSGGSVEKTKKAREIIANTIVGIVLYVAMWAFLNYLIPGGVFK